MGRSTPAGCSTPGASDTNTDARSTSPIYKKVYNHIVVMGDNKQNWILRKLTAYLSRWSGKLLCMHPLIATDKTAINEIEELADPEMDFCLLQVVLLHPSHVLAPLVLVSRVHYPLAWLHSVAEEVPNHAGTVKMRPLD